MVYALATLVSMYQVKFPNEAPQIIIMCLDRSTHVFVVEEIIDEKP